MSGAARWQCGVARTLHSNCGLSVRGRYSFDMFPSDIGMGSVFTSMSAGGALVLTTSFESRYALLFCGWSQRAFGLHVTSKASTLRLGHQFHIRLQHWEVRPPVSPLTPTVFRETSRHVYEWLLQPSAAVMQSISDNHSWVQMKLPFGIYSFRAVVNTPAWLFSLTLPSPGCMNNPLCCASTCGGAHGYGTLFQQY
jgi:hypothetical protein